VIKKIQQVQILSQDIKYLKGVGPGRAKILKDSLGIETVGDLLYTFPYRYIDRSRIHTIREMASVIPEEALQVESAIPYIQLKGQIVDFSDEGKGRKRRLKAVFTDGTGYVELVWFGGLNFVTENYKIGYTYLLLGKPNLYRQTYSFAHPELDEIEPSTSNPNLGLQPIYSIPEKMKKANFTSKILAKLIHNAFDLIPKGQLQETLPDYLIHRNQLVGLYSALRAAHFPTSSEELPLALHRLKFEELFYLQLDILHYRKGRKNKVVGFNFAHIGKNFLSFYNDFLPFSLTGAQKRVIKEIRSDLNSGAQMNRLLQGDVGSGKTIVALMCCLIAIDNDFQTCIMAPTEILAEQHCATIKSLVKGMPLRVELLTGSVKGKTRKKILEEVSTGSVKILIGTHALIEPTVHFQNLGLAVIDEQHRFGVKQRAALWQKNHRAPHILVMTATPIPRTLAMTVYGDLDVSILDELPPGRKPISTVHYYTNSLEKLIDGIRYQLQLGRQVYVVYPLVKESQKLDLQDAEKGAQQFQAWFPDFKVGLVHGQMKSDTKDAAMQAFIHNETQILISTTVIEVGVNVPNASVMVIMNAERFGLSQLHQLRGRVGRGAEQSYCILVSRPQLSEDTRRRLQIMCDTNDGFEIAEEDMKLRGPGDLEGTAQSGMPFDLKIANILRDNDLMEEARHVAEKILEEDPKENLPQNTVIWQQLQLLKKNKANFSEIS